MGPRRGRSRRGSSTARSTAACSPCTSDPPSAGSSAPRRVRRTFRPSAPCSGTGRSPCPISRRRSSRRPRRDGIPPPSPPPRMTERPSGGRGGVAAGPPVLVPELIAELTPLPDLLRPEEEVEAETRRREAVEHHRLVPLRGRLAWQACAKLALGEAALFPQLVPRVGAERRLVPPLPDHPVRPEVEGRPVGPLAEGALVVAALVRVHLPYRTARPRPPPDVLRGELVVHVPARRLLTLEGDPPLPVQRPLPADGARVRVERARRRSRTRRGTGGVPPVAPRVRVALHPVGAVALVAGGAERVALGIGVGPRRAAEEVVLELAVRREASLTSEADGPLLLVCRVVGLVGVAVVEVDEEVPAPRRPRWDGPSGRPAGVPAGTSAGQARGRQACRACCEAGVVGG
ncbi:hypothetical protein THAOC_19180, partial [Thalassiosira oceanica]